MMNLFENVPKAAPDPIFSVRTAFEKDPRKDKVNLGIGLYRTSDLKPYLLNSVKKAEEILFNKETNKEYLPILGDSSFIKETMKLVFGNDCDESLISGIQTVGGTNALRMGGELLAKYVTNDLFLSEPTWENHNRIFGNLGFNITHFPYFDWENKDLDVKGMLNAILKAPSKSVLFLQACCHNPTGLDPSKDTWKEIASIAKKRNLVVFFDFAYQGFGDGIAEDGWAIRYFVKEKIPVLVASSFSKNFGLYSERVGALFVVAKDKETKEKIDSQWQVIIRSLYSNPPSHGAKIVALILQDAALRPIWEKELDDMRIRMSDTRKALYMNLIEQDPKNKERFAFLTNQKGMFSFLGFRLGEVEQLIQAEGIYMLKEGRINISGLNQGNLPRVARAICKV